jgi:diguanylate cyclase
VLNLVDQVGAMSKLHPVTLTFKDVGLEQLFISKAFARTLVQGRIGIVLGSCLYLLFGLLDRWSIPEAHLLKVWTIRCLALCVPLCIFALTFRPIFRKASHLMLATLGLAANAGFLLIFPLIPLEQLGLFYPSIALTTIAAYCLVGTRFIYALVAELAVLVLYNILFLNIHGPIASTLLTHDFFLLSANAIGGVAGYLQELQNRRLFLREQELEQERQKHLNRSLHDSLTGLPNRELLFDRLAQALSESTREQSMHACFFIDLDGFKKINDQHGHELGDRVLRAAAAQLSLAVRDADTVARLGGDEFIVLCKGMASRQAAQAQAKRLVEHIENCHATGLARGAISASIGICLAPYAGVSVSDWIGRADKAMYQAKQAGRGNYVFAQTLNLADPVMLDQRPLNIATRFATNAAAAPL